jgi:hypothetical protein
LQISSGNVFPHPVEWFRSGHDDDAMHIWLQAPRHVEGFCQIESVHDADHVGRERPRRQFEIRDERVDDRHSREQGDPILQNKVERIRACGHYQIDPGRGVFVLQQLPHPHPLLGLREAGGIEELREQFQLNTGPRIHTGAKAAHELLVGGLLAVAARQDEDILLFGRSGSRHG